MNKEVITNGIISLGSFMAAAGYFSHGDILAGVLSGIFASVLAMVSGHSYEDKK